MGEFFRQTTGPVNGTDYFNYWNQQPFFHDTYSGLATFLKSKVPLISLPSDIGSL